MAETEQEHIKEYLREANASIVSPQTHHLAGKLSQAGTHRAVQGFKNLPKSGSKEPRCAWHSQEPWSKQSMVPALRSFLQREGEGLAELLFYPHQSVHQYLALQTVQLLITHADCQLLNAQYFTE